MDTLEHTLINQQKQIDALTQLVNNMAVILNKHETFEYPRQLHSHGDAEGMHKAILNIKHCDRNVLAHAKKVQGSIYLAEQSKAYLEFHR